MRCASAVHLVSGVGAGCPAAGQALRYLNRLRSPCLVWTSGFQWKTFHRSSYEAISSSNYGTPQLSLPCVSLDCKPQTSSCIRCSSVMLVKGLGSRSGCSQQPWQGSARGRSVPLAVVPSVFLREPVALIWSMARLSFSSCRRGQRWMPCRLHALCAAGLEDQSCNFWLCNGAEAPHAI